MKTAFIFPGQGAQYVGMGKDLYETFSIAREVFQEADDRLKRKLSRLAFEGPEGTLTEAKNSQLAIYVMSVATWRVLKEEFGLSAPDLCAGLSLGEYTALTAAGRLPFADGLALVQKRAEFMNAACEQTHGTMAVVIGLPDAAVEEAIAGLHLPQDLWIANYNCPGQVVLSGTKKGIAAGSDAVKAAGAKRVLPLNVHGAFHSGLMALAQEQLSPYIDATPLTKTAIPIVMNVSGEIVTEATPIRENLKQQVTGSVRWHQGIDQMQKEGVERYLEIGCGTTLAGMNKRIGVTGTTRSVGRLDDLKTFEQEWGKA